MAVRTSTEAGMITRKDLEVFLRNSGLVKNPSKQIQSDLSYNVSSRM